MPRNPSRRTWMRYSDFWGRFQLVSDSFCQLRAPTMPLAGRRARAASACTLLLGCQQCRRRGSQSGAAPTLIQRSPKQARLGCSLKVTGGSWDADTTNKQIKCLADCQTACLVVSKRASELGRVALICAPIINGCVRCCALRQPASHNNQLTSNSVTVC